MGGSTCDSKDVHQSPETARVDVHKVVISHDILWYVANEMLQWFERWYAVPDDARTTDSRP